MKINGTDVKKMTNAELDYTMKDLAEVIKIQESFEPAGYHAPKLPQYMDEAAAVGREIARRAGTDLVTLKLKESDIDLITDCLNDTLRTYGPCDAYAMSLAGALDALNAQGVSFEIE